MSFFLLWILAIVSSQLMVCTSAFTHRLSRRGHQQREAVQQQTERVDEYSAARRPSQTSDPVSCPPSDREALVEAPATPPPARSPLPSVLAMTSYFIDTHRQAIDLPIATHVWRGLTIATAVATVCGVVALAGAGAAIGGGGEVSARAGVLLWLGVAGYVWYVLNMWGLIWLTDKQSWQEQRYMATLQVSAGSREL